MGTSTWKNGMSLIRIPAGSNTTGSFGSGGGMWGNKHSGSLFDLDPGKTWEIQLTLTDPDGGSMTTTTTASTRAVPVAAANAVTKQVTPSNFSSMLSGAMPGDILLLGAGNYAAFSVSKNGAAGQPIVIRGESVDTVIIGGNVTASDRQYVHLENLTVNGGVKLTGSSNMVVRGCRVHTPAGGITFLKGNAVPRNNTIVDNDVVGPAVWQDDQLAVNGFDGGEGIQFTGSGHVICFNHVKDFRDDISFMEYDEGYEQTSIDICNNDVEEATDDGIEADSAMGNVRIFRNRIHNCFDGISAQPDLGGPTYYVRNAMYNVIYSPFKFHNGTVGDIVLHNSVVKCGDAYACEAGETWKRAMFRNNLFIGGMGGGSYGGFSNGSGRILDAPDADSSCTFDYDGFGSIGISSFQGRVGSSTFNSLATLKSNTTEAHAVQVDMSVFASPPSFPSPPLPARPGADLRLATGSAAIDKGLVITGLNDDFAGSAPDLGAYEMGAAMPTYGPRVDGVVTGGGGSSGTGAGGTTGAAGSGGSGMVSGRGGSGVVSGAGGSSGTGSAGTAGSDTSGAAGTLEPPGTGGDPRSGSGGAGSFAQAETIKGGCACSSAGSGPGAGTGASLLLAAAALVRRRSLAAAKRRAASGGR